MGGAGLHLLARRRDARAADGRRDGRPGRRVPLATVRLRPLVRRELDEAAGHLSDGNACPADGPRRDPKRPSGRHRRAGRERQVISGRGPRPALAREGSGPSSCAQPPLAVELAEALADRARARGLEVHTFTAWRDAGRGRPASSPSPAERGADWFDRELPAALDRAIAARPDARRHAIVGTRARLRPLMLESLDLLLERPARMSSGHSTTPARRSTATTSWPTRRCGRSLDLQEVALADNYRNPGPVNDLAARFLPWTGGVEALRDDGDAPWIREAIAGEPTTGSCTGPWPTLSGTG